MNRYHRQILLPQIGPQGQARLGQARALLVGCGALGTVLAEQLVRAGIGALRIVDRDIVELTNLQRQVLFDERDVLEQAPKAVAAARRLGQINSSVVIEPVVADLHAGNLEELAGFVGDRARIDIILDGTDNVETRYLLNDVSVKHEMPWVYGACVGMEGRAMGFSPPTGPCLRCLFPSPAGPGELPTCDAAGVFSPLASIVASLQCSAAVKLLLRTSQNSLSAAYEEEGAGNSPGSGEPVGSALADAVRIAPSQTHDSPARHSAPASAKADPTGNQLVTIDLWENRFRTLDASESKRPDCLTCGQRRFEFLDRRGGSNSASLCGRNAVQIRPVDHRNTIDLTSLAQKLAGSGRIEQTPYLLRCDLNDPPAVKLTLFVDGRLIVHGTNDPDKAKSIYARYIGS